jgi:hypothetical protein
MASADMIADNPGTWLFHCHVADHMESGMMALYTIYPPPRACPVRFVAETWERLSGASQIRISNASSRLIRHVDIVSGYLVSTLELRPLFVQWSADQPLAPGGQEPVQIGTEMFTGQGNLGVAFFPSRVVYQDGSEWKPQQLGDCFHVYWRNQDHPQLPVLPPFQFEQKED